MRAFAALLALAVVSAQAQSSTTKYGSELDMTIDAGSVSQTKRATWCQGQTNTCGLLCNNNYNSNDCSESDLKWKCTCASNSSMPGIQYYKQTVPFYTCIELFERCIAANVGSQEGQKGCNTNIMDLCAKNDPPKAAVADGGSGSSSSSAASSASPTASASGNNVVSTSSRALAGPTMAPIGNGALVAAMGVMAYMV